MLESEGADEAFGIKVLGKETADVLVLLFVVELKFGIAEAFVQRHVCIGSILLDSDGGQAAVAQEFQCFGIWHFMVGTGQDDASKFFVGQRFVVLNDFFKTPMRSGSKHGDVAGL